MEGKETSRHRERKEGKRESAIVLQSGARKMQKVGISKVQIYKWAHLSYLCTLASHLACARFASGLHQRWACLEIDLLTQFSIIGASIPHGSKQTCLHARPSHMPSPKQAHRTETTSMPMPMPIAMPWCHSSGSGSGSGNGSGGGRECGLYKNLALLLARHHVGFRPPFWMICYSNTVR